MKLCLIYPHLFSQGRSTDSMEPLAMAALAAQTPENWQISFYDDRQDSIPHDLECDLAALSVATYQAKRAYKIADQLRSRGIKVVMGGFHPSLLPQEALEHCDAVVTGDCENVWAQLLEHVTEGKLQRLYHGGICSDPGKIAFDRSIFKGKKYSPMVPVQLSRGCLYNCDFCSIQTFYQGNQLMRPLNNILQEIASISAKFLFFTDDNLLVQGKQLPGLLKGLIPLKKKWSCQISIEAAYQPELLHGMAKAGCTTVFVGFESMNQENLSTMQKGKNLKYNDYSKAVQGFRRAGLMVCGAFVFGYDQDNRQGLYDALDFAQREKLTLCHFNPLYPYPGTQVYQRLEDEGRLLYPQWWLHGDFRYGEPMFRPKNMEPRELTELCFELRRRFNSPGSIFRRLWQRQSHLSSPFKAGAYLISNLVSRREIYRKQGEALG